MEAAVLNRLIEITVYSAALFAGVLLFRFLLGRWLSPALKYALWFLVVLRLVVPVTLESGFHFISLPGQIPQTAPAAVSATPLQSVPADDGPPLPNGQAQPAPLPLQTARQPAAQRPEKSALSLNWRQWLLVAWATGFMAVLGAHLALSLRLERRVLKCGRALGPGALRLYRSIKADLGIRARLPVLVMDDLTSPALTAQLRPRLLLPDMLARNASSEQLLFSLLHELLHYRRRDYLVCILLTLLRAVWWFNPVVWLMPRFLRADMESACDAQAVRKLDRRQKLRYANLLLELGQRNPRL